MNDRFIENQIAQIKQTIETLKKSPIDIKDRTRQELLREAKQFLKELKILRDNQLK